MKKFGYVIGLLIVLAGAGWWWVGPVWRSFLLNPPTDTDVLFWSQSQRDSGFALSDRIPTIKSQKIEFLEVNLSTKG